MRILVGFFTAAALVLAAGNAPAETPSAVGYVTKSATNLGWVIINKGAEDAAREAGVKLIVEAALRANPGAKLVANAWDDGMLGTVAALKVLGVEKGRIRVIGFDGAPNALALLRAGWVQADVAQMLYRQGYEGVKTRIAAAKGEAVPARIDTGHQLVTAENVERFIKENKLAEFMK